MNALFGTPLRRLVAALLSGAMLGKVVNLTPWWPLAWVAPVPLLLAAFHATAREARALGLLAATIGLGSTFGYYRTTNGAAVATLLIGLQALGWSAVVYGARQIVLGSTAWFTVFAYPLYWAALDTLISALSPHGSFGSLAYSQGDLLPIVQLASLGGTPAVVFVVCLGASALATALYRRRSIDDRRLAYGLPCALVASALAFGGWRLARPLVAAYETVGVVAIDDFVGARSSPASADAVWAGYTDAVTRLAAQGARLVLLPEKIEVLDAGPAAPRLEQLASVARRSGVYVAAGTGHRDEGGLHNRLWVFSPDGSLVASYDKQRLVPGLEAAFSIGRRDATVAIGGATYGLAICKDFHFASVGRGYGRLGVDAMLVPAWDFQADAWLTARMTTMRGVEGGFSVIRASREGLLTVSDAMGRVVAETPSAALPGSSLLVRAPIGAASPTLYARVGDVFGWACVLLAAALRWQLTRRGAGRADEGRYPRPAPT